VLRRGSAPVDHPPELRLQPRRDDRGGPGAAGDALPLTPPRPWPAPAAAARFPGHRAGSAPDRRGSDRLWPYCRARGLSRAPPTPSGKVPPMEAFNSFITSVDGFLGYVLVAVLVPVGLYLTIRTGVVQLRLLPEMLRLIREPA